MNQQSEMENKLKSIKKEKRNLVRDFIIIIISPFIFFTTCTLASFAYSEYVTYKYRDVVNGSVCNAGTYPWYTTKLNFMKILAVDGNNFTVACDYKITSSVNKDLNGISFCKQIEFKLLPDGSTESTWHSITINNPFGSGGESFTWPPYCF